MVGKFPKLYNLPKGHNKNSPIVSPKDNFLLQSCIFLIAVIIDVYEETLLEFPTDSKPSDFMKISYTFVNLNLKSYQNCNGYRVNNNWSIQTVWTHLHIINMCYHPVRPFNRPNVPYIPGPSDPIRGISRVRVTTTLTRSIHMIKRSSFVRPTACNRGWASAHTHIHIHSLQPFSGMRHRCCWWWCCCYCVAVPTHWTVSNVIGNYHIVWQGS